MCERHMLEALHRFELARAAMLGEVPLSPAQLLALADYIEHLDDDSPDWPDRLAADADTRAAAGRTTE